MTSLGIADQMFIAKKVWVTGNLLLDWSDTLKEREVFPGEALA